MFISARNLPQHRADDETVKRQDRRKIDPAEQIVCQHERGRGDAAALATGCDVDHDAKIQVLVVEAGNDVFKPNGFTRAWRTASNASIHRGDRPNIRSAACRASSAVSSTAML